MRHLVAVSLLVVSLTVFPREVRAQTPAVEFSGSFAAFVDDSRIDHGAFGATLRVPLTPRISVGPELVYMIGPGSDRDLFVTGNLTYDLVRPRGLRPAPVVPYLVIGGGIMGHRQGFATGSFVSWEGAVAGGGGIRVALTERFTVATEVRAGWEPHVRVTGVVGIRLGPLQAPEEARTGHHRR